MILLTANVAALNELVNVADLERFDIWRIHPGTAVGGPWPD